MAAFLASALTTAREKASSMVGEVQTKDLSRKGFDYPLNASSNGWIDPTTEALGQASPLVPKPN
jgi:hypothetical protein